MLLSSLREKLRSSHVLLPVSGSHLLSVISTFAGRGSQRGATASLDSQAIGRQVVMGKAVHGQPLLYYSRKGNTATNMPG